MLLYIDEIVSTYVLLCDEGLGWRGYGRVREFGSSGVCRGMQFYYSYYALLSCSYLIHLLSLFSMLYPLAKKVLDRSRGSLL